MGYKVLWIDDEFEKQKDFIGLAEQMEIDIKPVESHEEGIKVLEKDLDTFDAIILDAKVKMKENDIVSDLEGLKASRDYLEKLNENYFLPYFIFTGQPDYLSNDIFKQSYGEYYVKGKDNEKLLTDLIYKVHNKQEYILKNNFKNVFELCTDHYLGSDSYSSLLDVLRNLEETNINLRTEDLLNPLRKIVEKLFGAFNRMELLPDEVFKGAGWINKSSIFLSGKHKEYELTAEIMPPAISFIFFNCLSVIQDASHAEGDLRLKIDAHIKYNQSNYLYKSVVFQLLEVLVWFKKYSDDDPKKNCWIEKDVSDCVRGVIEQDENGNYYCDQYLLPFTIVKERYKVGDKIVISNSDINKNSRTNGLYKYFVLSFTKTDN